MRIKHWREMNILCHLRQLHIAVKLRPPLKSEDERPGGGVWRSSGSATSRKLAMTILNRIMQVVLLPLALLQTVAASTALPPTTSTSIEQRPEKIAPYVPRFGRSRPIIAVVGENGSTVLVDFVVPYSVLVQSRSADVVSVATQPGPLRLPPLQINPDSTVAQFDDRYPEGADYVIVPAVMKNDDPKLIEWVTSQAGKGATLVSICNGSLVLANAGLTRGHRATGHWSTYESRVKNFPQTHWLKNTRYVADGKIVSSAGISAAFPISLALVEAIAGPERAELLAKRLGVEYWGTAHDSDVFHIGFGDYVTGFSNTVLHIRQDIGVPMAPDMDEITLALTANAYADTMRGTVYGVSQSDAPVKTRGGLTFIPDRVAGSGKPMDIMLPDADATPSARMQGRLIDDITRRYGAATGRFVAIDWEYPATESAANKAATN